MKTNATLLWMLLVLARTIASSSDAHISSWESQIPLTQPSLASTQTEKKLPRILEPPHSWVGEIPPLPILSEDLSTFRWSKTANWLVPGRIMLGRYPGSEPKQPVDAATQRLRIIDLRLHGNVSTFVSLQKEVPPQDSGKTWGFVGHAATDNVDADHYHLPYRRGFVPYYRDIVKSVPAAQPGQVKHFNIVDRQPAASITALDKLIENLAYRALHGEVLYIHCWGGQGRTGLVAACLLGWLYPELDSEQALARVQAYFNLRGKPGPSPETDEQTEQVREWFTLHKSWLRNSDLPNKMHIAPHAKTPL